MSSCFHQLHVINGQVVLRLNWEMGETNLQESLRRVSIFTADESVITEIV